MLAAGPFYSVFCVSSVSSLHKNRERRSGHSLLKHGCMVIIFLHYVTRGYEIGDFGYWNAGPDLAIFYDDIYKKTIVRVISLGHASSGAEALAHEKGKVRLELVN